MDHDPTADPPGEGDGERNRRSLDRRRFLVATGTVGTATFLAGCPGDPGPAVQPPPEPSPTETAADESPAETPTDPSTAPRVTVDRFSEAAGTLFVRTEDDDLPAPGEPIDFDQQPFLTQGFGPQGGVVQYYNFDVRPVEPASMYVFVRDAEETPIEDQLNVIDALPGDRGYNDFWHVHQVSVPSDYTANTVTSRAEIEASNYLVNETNTLVNFPVVPAGSTAEKRGGDAPSDPVEGWYRDQVVTYFEFREDTISPKRGVVPVWPIYVAFQTNPGQPGGGAESGFMTEADGVQTHNVVSTLPGGQGYSPLWSVNAYDNDAFESVTDLQSARNAEQLAVGIATVNCPIVTMPRRIEATPTG